jgi:hypothetical protein
MSRKKERDELAAFGEVRACQLLRKEDFVVERMPKNFPFFDLMATRGSCRMLVPVKTRNNTTSKGKLKTNSYNLYTKPGHHEAATKIAAFAGAKSFWVAVTVDAKGAFLVVNCQSALVWLALRSCSQAAISSRPRNRCVERVPFVTRRHAGPRFSL